MAVSFLQCLCLTRKCSCNLVLTGIDSRRVNTLCVRFFVCSEIYRTENITNGNSKPCGEPHIVLIIEELVQFIEWRFAKSPISSFCAVECYLFCFFGPLCSLVFVDRDIIPARNIYEKRLPMPSRSTQSSQSSFSKYTDLSFANGSSSDLLVPFVLFRNSNSHCEREY